MGVGGSPMGSGSGPDMIEISSNVSIAENEIDIAFIRAQGAGGQNC